MSRDQISHPQIHDFHRVIIALWYSGFALKCRPSVGEKREKYSEGEEESCALSI